MASENLETRQAPLQPTGTLDKTKSRHAITILRSAEDIYLFWRNFENLALFMKDIKKIEVLSPTRSRWTIELKSGRSIDWLAEIRGEIPGQMISWSSLEGESVQTSGLRQRSHV